ncbi:MAG TPA: lytic transglycosylase domain-containing protein [Candidatus Dormibacteraeota bacterium]|nr:lytic transglycosylase domain-containing protein [Candidatus Dormibacteraeota bacterium]
MRLARLVLLVAGLALIAPELRAEYVVLRSGQRLNVTGYQIVGETYRLQLNGGFVEVPAAEVLSIEPEEVFASEPKKAEPAIAAPYGALITAAAAKYSVDADLISSVIAAESNFNPKAVSRRNARGLMQLMPQTAAHLGVQNSFDPKENIDGGTHYLRDLLQRYKNDLILTLAAYNAGPERVYTQVPAIRETRNYVVRVKHNFDQRKSDQRKSEKQKAAAPAGFAEPKTSAPPTAPTASTALPAPMPANAPAMR